MQFTADAAVPPAIAPWARTFILAAIGILMHQALHIRWLKRLPDFPVGDLFATAAAACGLALLASLFQRFSLPTLAFGTALLLHLAATSAPYPWQTETYRMIALGLCIASAIWCCVGLFVPLNGTQLLCDAAAMWLIGECTASALSVFYGPSLGEATSWKTYSGTLGFMAVSAIIYLAIALASHRLSMVGLLGFIAVPILAAIVSLVMPHPVAAQKPLLLLAAIRILAAFLR